MAPDQDEGRQGRFPIKSMREIEEQIAVISDVHGNSLALMAVLDDIGSRGIERILNLGDCVYGPLDPAGTADMLISRKIPSVRGNEDRILSESNGEGAMSVEAGKSSEAVGSGSVGGEASGIHAKNPSLQFTLERLTGTQLVWISLLQSELYLEPDLYLCHGSPGDDTRYLLWTVDESGARRSSDEEIMRRLAGVEASLVLCGHDHRQSDRRLPDGRLVVDAGSVGLQAYTDDLPYPHVMEEGSPHARYSILYRRGGGWEVEHRSVAYDWESASRMAAGNGRPDWARWLLTGRIG
jgi:predicted phosphodiesterase